MIEHSGPISGVAVSPSNLVATAGYDNRVILWQGRQALVETCHDHLANQCAFSSDGSLLVSASSDYTARIWRAQDLSPVAVLRDHEDDVEMALFNPSGNRIATASRDYRVRIFDSKGRLQLRMEGHSADAISVTWSRDGDQLVSSSDDGTLRRWCTHSGAQLELIDVGSVETDTVAMAPDGTLYAGNDAGELLRIDVADVRRIPAHAAGVKRVVIDPNGRHLASCSYDRTLKVWNLRGDSTELICTTQIPSKVWPRSAAFAPEGWLALGTFGSAWARFDTATGEWDLDGVNDTPGLNAVCRFGDIEYSVGDAGVVLQQGAPVRRLGSLCNFLQPWRDRLVTGGQLGVLFDARSGAALHHHHSPLNCATVNHLGELVVGTYTGEGLCFAADGDRVYLKHVLLLHEQAVKGLAASGERMLSVSAAGDATLIDGTQRRFPRVHDRIANGVCALADGRFATVSRDRCLRIWEGMQVHRVLSPHDHSIKCVRATSCGRWVVTGSYDGSVGFYNLQEGRWRPLQRPTRAGISSLANGTGHDEVLASSYDGRVYRLSPST